MNQEGRRERSSAPGRYKRSFYDALSLARNRRDQATIYYSKDGVRAAYDVVTERAAEYVNIGTMFLKGRCVTAADVPPTMRASLQVASDAALVGAVKSAKVAKAIFEWNGIDVETGWDLRP